MSKRNKLQKFEEILSFPNVYENYSPLEPKLVKKDNIEVDLRGKWAKEHFGNDNPVVLELACGRGEYSLGLARMFKDKNYIGVDIKGARIWKGATIAIEEELDHVAFLRTRIEVIKNFFAEGEIDQIWIIFPDPFLREAKANRRLTSPRFLESYRYLLKKGGTINLKTDDPTLYEYTLETLAEDDKINIQYQDDDIYAKELPMEELDIKTYYEKQHLRNGRTIKYVRFNFVD